MEMISVDDHLIEHPKVWSDRLPRKYLEAGPKIIEWERPDTGQMCQVWEYEGRIYPYIGLNAVAGKKPEEYGIEPVRYDDMIPGCYDPKARVADMDIDGVQAMTCFPSFPGSPAPSSPRARTKSWRCCARRRGMTSTSTSGPPPRPTGSSLLRCCRSGILRKASRRSTALPARAPSA
ncbi:amidohydrolase 2 domain protein [Mycobacterium avium subsp. avium 2285 (R)]|nr:amidohydrolase 2 domain protein [Mycobacterium avium subsp. avium 2285 (R)]